MGEHFIKNMLYSLIQDENFPLELNDIEAVSFGNLIIETEIKIDEASIVDIILFDPINRFLFVIENKFGANLTNNQLERYSEWSDRQIQTNKIQKKVQILIDGQNSVSKVTDGWCKTNYEWITKSILAVLNRGILTADIEKILKDYYISLECDYTIEAQHRDYEKHLIRLAERYSDFIDWLQNKHQISLGDYDLVDIFNEFETFDSDFVLTVYNNRAIFNELVEYGRYDWLQDQLKTISPGSFQYEIKGRRFNVFSKNWLPYLSDPEGYWPIYLQLEEVGDNEFQISIWLKKKYIKPESAVLFDNIATQKGKKFRANQKSLKIPLHEPISWNKDQLLTKIKKELKFISVSI